MPRIGSSGVSKPFNDSHVIPSPCVRADSRHGKLFVAVLKLPRHFINHGKRPPLLCARRKPPDTVADRFKAHPLLFCGRLQGACFQIPAHDGRYSAHAHIRPEKRVQAGKLFRREGFEFQHMLKQRKL